jgi:hypothetical protein
VLDAVVITYYFLRSSYATQKYKTLGDIVVLRRCGYMKLSKVTKETGYMNSKKE